jgi:hypothetical protein
MAGLALALVGVGVSSASSAAQTVPVPQLRLTGPVFEIGRMGVELHRVRAAVSLPGGRLAIADGSSARILVFDAEGALETSIGRKGEGPGEFSLLYGLGAGGDTLVAWDPGLSRVTRWLADGTLIDTHPVARFGDYSVEIVAILSSTDYLARSLATLEEPSGSGLFDAYHQLLRVHIPSGEVTDLGRRLWSRQFLHVQPGGASATYRTPFLGSTLAGGDPETSVLIPLDSANMEIGDGRGAVTRQVPLPLARRRFSRDLVDSYRDSLIASVPPEDRAGLSRWEATMREVFGEDFPMPEYAPILHGIATAGDHLWLQAYAPTGAALREWYAMSISEGRPVGRVSLQRGSLVMGGTEARVFVLERDEFDVEYVAVYEVEAGGREADGMDAGGTDAGTECWPVGP